MDSDGKVRQKLLTPAAVTSAFRSTGVSPRTSAAIAYRNIAHGVGGLTGPEFDDRVQQAKLRVEAKELDAADEYDYIIVGAGGNGCIVANEIALANKKSKVLVIDAGKEPPADANVWDPACWTLLQSDSELEWNYRSTCQSGLYGRMVALARARSLGGSTVHHSFLWVRGGRKVLDDWVNKFGCEGWGWSDLDPYYTKIEQELPIRVGDPGKDSSWENSLREAFIDSGLSWIPDYNIQDQTGSSYTRYAPILGGKRVTLYEIFISSQQHDMPNLTTLSEKFVNRVILDDHNVAYGIQYRPFNDRAGPITTVKANKEVILTAGAIATPQLLMLSGIGDPDVLKNAGIIMRFSSPGVGKNLVDDVYVSCNYKTSKEIPSTFYEYGIGGIIGFTDEIYEITVQSNLMPGLFNIPDSWKPGFQIGMDVHFLKSRGSIELDKNDVIGNPVINVNYLAEPEDMEASVQALQILRRIAASDKLANWAPTEVMPGPRVQNDNIQALEAYIRGTASTTFHYSGTCRMGVHGKGPLKTPPVVDPASLKVYGIKNLRILDASIFPENPNGNPQVMSYIVALKGAALINKENVVP